MKDTFIYRCMKNTALASLFVMSAMHMSVSTAWSDVQEVDVALEVHRVILDADANIELEPADDVEPGDLLRYIATYHNTGVEDVNGLFGQLPIPEGTEYVAGTASPTGVLASLDGVTFAPVPLTRIEGEGDDQRVVEIPASEYRYLRWALSTIGADASASVSADMRVAQ